MERGLMDAQTQLAMTRAMGQSLARLAEWQVSAITDVLGQDQDVPEELTVAAAQELVPVMEGLTVVQVVIGRDGRLLEAQVVRSSGVVATPPGRDRGSTARPR